jgi:hypothetical protein
VAADARRALLEHLIDHAPMFPPAQLPLDEALADHAAARASDASWMLNRFVVRASAFVPERMPDRLSVVADAEVPDDPRIEAVELPPSHSGWLLAPEIYAEVAPDADLERLKEHGFRAKIRCGGERVPTPREVAGFIRECRRLRLPFKATAGLHSAVRHDAAHGFLNVLAAAVFGHEERVLTDESRDAFELTPDGFSWHGNTARADEVTAVRRDLFVSIGSCSFFEPVEELQALGIL